MFKINYNLLSAQQADPNLSGEQHLMIAIIERATLDALGLACTDHEKRNAHNWFFVKEKECNLNKGITAQQAFAGLNLDFEEYKAKLWDLIKEHAANPSKKMQGYQRIRYIQNRRKK